MKKALVSGSAGLVGKEVALQLLKEGYEVHGIDNHSREKFFNIPVDENDVINDANYIHFDIDITDDMAMFVLHSNYDVIVHCAAQPSHSLANSDPELDFKINVIGTQNMLGWASRYCPGVTFVYLSTTKVFSDWMNEDCIDQGSRYHCKYRLNELSQTQGNHGLFGVHKLASDMIVQEYGRYYDLKTIVFRPGCITGKAHKGVREHGFLSYLAQCVKEDKEYIINGYEGKQVRDQIHVSDMASAIIETVKDPKSDYYVIGGGAENSISVLEAIEKLEKLTGKKLKHSFIKAREADHKWNVHDNSKFQEAYPNWKITKDLDYILKELI